MSNARQEILELVANGKISAAEAAKLLSQEGEPTKEPQVEAQMSSVPPETAKASEVKTNMERTIEEVAGKPSLRWLRVRVSDLESGKSRVRVNIPIQLVRVGMKMGRGFVPEMEGLNWEEIEASIAGSEGGLLVDVEDEESGEHVQVYVE